MLYAMSYNIMLVLSWDQLSIYCDAQGVYKWALSSLPVNAWEKNYKRSYLYILRPGLLSGV